MKPRLAVLAMSFVAACLSAQTSEGPAKWFEDFEKRFPPVKKNATAEELERLALALGIDRNFESSAPEDHPAKEDLEAYRQAQVSSWLDAQLKTSDDSIATPPPQLRRFFEGHRAVIAEIAGLLAREPPEWGFDARKHSEARPDLMLILSLSRTLVSGALTGERAGHHGEAKEFLEASWSLYKSAAAQPDIPSQLVAIAAGKFQAGALRKMSEASFEWLDRMEGDEPRELMLEALRNAPLLSHRPEADSGPGSFFDAWSRAWRSVADGLRDLSPCQISKLSDEEIWRPARQELVRWRDAGTAEGQATLEMAMPNLTQALRRIGRLLVDRELTSKILQLRQEKAASREGRWPVRFLDTESKICPEAEYEYQSHGIAMTIRFRGTIDAPGAPALILPLSFQARASKPTPTPTRAPNPAATRAPHP